MSRQSKTRLTLCNVNLPFCFLYEIEIVSEDLATLYFGDYVERFDLQHFNFEYNSAACNVDHVNFNSFKNHYNLQYLNKNFKK